MPFKSPEEVFNAELPLPKRITKKAVELSKKLVSRFGGNARLATGRIFTDEEYEEWRKKVLSKPLP